MTLPAGTAAGVSGPTASVCIATYHRPEALARALACVAGLTPPPGGFEVVVVDDGSPAEDRIADVVDDARRRIPSDGTAGAPEIRLLQQPNRGAAAARNRAWREARGEWIAFTDDDCRPSPDWLVRLVAAAANSGADVAQGRTRPDPDRAHLLGNPLARSMRVDSLNGFFQTCNIAYRRTLLARLGGFDESLTRSGEDTDLGWRARKAGAAAVFAADALVDHDVVVRTWRQDLRDRRRWQDVPRVVRRHPETRALAWRRWIYRRQHVAPLFVAATAPALAWRTGRRAWAFAGATAVLAEIVASGSPGAARSRLQRRVGDAYETALVCAASLRSRCLLL